MVTQPVMTELDLRDNRYPSVSYSLPNGTPRVVERYSLDEEPVDPPVYKVYPQQPTFAAVAPIKPVVEEVCIECAMRDQDMADVDVSSPSVWERESDIFYEELKRNEAAGLTSDDKPRAVGGKLTEQNLKIWLSVNPREPTSRQQTLNNYLKAQRTLLEAEALAHARAVQEAKQLENKVRDTYSRLRMSESGVRLSQHSTLLENGLIVEHVDVRKEEQRKRKEERRARKSSRSSGIDITSLMSNPQTDSGIGLRPYSHYAQPTYPRPLSVLTAPLDRSIQSQASFSDIHSLGTPSPRRSRFLGIANRWRSQDSLAPSGMSGSMVDMQWVQLDSLFFANNIIVLPTANFQSTSDRVRYGPPWSQQYLNQRKRRLVSQRYGILSPDLPNRTLKMKFSLSTEQKMNLSPHRPRCHISCLVDTHPLLRYPTYKKQVLLPPLLRVFFRRHPPHARLMLISMSR